ncbi:MAG: hypothetical protein HY717_01845 [Planctomycetes bacterium]|nr:hypothetical protein [Planctomycetota bacterium]
MFRRSPITSLVLVVVGLLVAGAFGTSRPALGPVRLPLKLEKGKVLSFQVERQRQSERPRAGPEKEAGKEAGKDTSKDTVKEGTQAKLEYQITVESVAANGEATLLASIKKAVIDSSGERSFHFDSSAAAAADEGEMIKKLREALGKSLSIKVDAEGRLGGIEGLNSFQPARPEGGDRSAWRASMLLGESLAPLQIQGDLERMIGSGLHNVDLETGKTYELAGPRGRIRAEGGPGRPGAGPGGRPRPRASEKPEDKEKGEKKPEKKESASAADSLDSQDHSAGLFTSALAGDQDDKKDEGGKKEGEKGENPRPPRRPGGGSQPPERPLNLRDRMPVSGNVGLRCEGEAKEGELELVKFAVVSREPQRGRGESEAARAQESKPLGEATYRKGDGLLEKFALKREFTAPESAARRFSSLSQVTIQRMK